MHTVLYHSVQAPGTPPRSKRKTTFLRDWSFFICTWHNVLQLATIILGMSVPPLFRVENSQPFICQ